MKFIILVVNTQGYMFLRYDFNKTTDFDIRERDFL